MMSIWLSLTTTKGKFPNVDKWKIKKFEKQFSTKKSRPIFIFTSDKYSLASVDLVLEKFKPFGVKPKITQSLSKADFVGVVALKWEWPLQILHPTVGVANLKVRFTIPWL